MSDTNDNDNIDGDLNVGWITLIIVTLAVFIISIDLSFLNVSITTIVHDLHTTIVTLQSIIVIYALVLASLTIFCGELDKVLGRRKSFLIGAVIYGIGTLIAAISLNSNMLLLGWSILEGIGGALMFVSSYSIIVGSYSGKRRALALGLLASVASGASVVGPFIGGFLTTYYTWRYAFGLEFFVIIFILIFSRSIQYFPTTVKWSEINIIGAINAGLGIFLFVYGLILLNNPNTLYISPLIILAGIILLIIFYFDQRRRLNKNEHPLIDIRIFQNKSFNLGNIIRFLYGIVLGGIRFIIAVFVQTVLGFSALTTSYIFIAMAIPMFLITFTTGPVSERFQPRYIITLGFLTALIGSIYLTTNFSPHTSLFEIIIGISLIGLGIGIIAPHASNLTFYHISREQQPDASAIRSTNSNLTSSMGTAILGLILLTGSTNTLSIEKLVGGMMNAFYIIIILLLTGILVSQFIQPYHKKK